MVMKIFWNRKFSLMHIVSVSGGVAMCGVKIPPGTSTFDEDSHPHSKRCGKCIVTRSNYTGAKSTYYQQEVQK